MKLRLKELRIAKGWTQDQLAAKLGCSKSHVSEMEGGKKNASGPMLEAISKTFDVSLAEVIDSGDLGNDVAAAIEMLRMMSPEDRRNALRAVAGFVTPQGQ